MLPTDRLITPSVLLAAIKADLSADIEPRAARAVAVRHLAAAKAEANAGLAQAFAAAPLRARALVAAQARLQNIPCDEADPAAARALLLGNSAAARFRRCVRLRWIPTRSPARC